jgi:hypothetical protein
LAVNTCFTPSRKAWARSTLRRSFSTHSAGIVYTRFLPPSM